MQFGFVPGKGITDLFFILRRKQEEYHDKKRKLFMCFVDMEKAFDRVPRKVMEWTMRKKVAPTSRRLNVVVRFPPLYLRGGLKWPDPIRSLQSSEIIFSCSRPLTGRSWTATLFFLYDRTLI